MWQGEEECVEEDDVNGEVEDGLWQEAWAGLFNAFDDHFILGRSIGILLQPLQVMLLTPAFNCSDCGVERFEERKGSKTWLFLVSVCFSH